MCVFRLSHTSADTTFLSKARLLFSHASAEVRGENAPERKFASSGDRTQNNQVMSPTRSLLSHPGGAVFIEIEIVACNVFKFKRV